MNEIRYDLIKDKDGFIIGYKLVESDSELKQSATLSEAQNYLAHQKEVVDNFLEHFGVKGMRWGIRRRSSSSEQGADSARNPATPKVTIKSNRGGLTRYGEKAKRLSDEELNTRIKRLETERKYKQLNSKYVSTGRKHINEVLTSIGKDTVKKVGTSTATFLLKRTINNRFRLNMPDLPTVTVTSVTS